MFTECKDSCCHLSPGHTHPGDAHSHTWTLSVAHQQIQLKITDKVCMCVCVTEWEVLVHSVPHVPFYSCGLLSTTSVTRMLSGTYYWNWRGDKLFLVRVGLVWWGPEFLEGHRCLASIH